MIAEGDYHAVVKQVKPQGYGKVRLVFTVTVPGCPSPCLAGKNYLNDLSYGSVFRNDLFALRGHDVTPEEIRRGSIDTNDLVAKPAEIRIGHIENEGYGDPFVHIKEIYPPGTLVATSANALN